MRKLLNNGIFPNEACGITVPTAELQIAALSAKIWYIPENAQKLECANKKNDAPTLLQILR